MLKISIPSPCHEDWNKMTHDKTGRHCSSCAKSVVDFTSMSDDEVKHFFLNKKEDERVCGRFKQTQLHRIVVELPQNIFSIQMPLWKKFLAACLVVFSTTLFSCETKMNGTTVGDIVIEQPVRSDATGMVAISPIQNDTLPEPLICKTTIGFTAPEIIKGDIEIVELEPTVGIIALNPVRDTTYTSFTEQPLKQGLPVAPVKIKNPPKADSINCKTIKNYY